MIVIVMDINNTHKNGAVRSCAIGDITLIRQLCFYNFKK